MNSRAAQYLLDLTKIFDSTVNREKVLQFQLHTEPLYELTTIAALYSGLGLIWRNRQNKKGTTLYDIRADLECLIHALRKSRTRKLKEAGSIISNNLDNFYLNPTWKGGG